MLAGKTGHERNNQQDEEEFSHQHSRGSHRFQTEGFSVFISIPSQMDAAPHFAACNNLSSWFRAGSFFPASVYPTISLTATIIPMRAMHVRWSVSLSSSSLGSGSTSRVAAPLGPGDQCRARQVIVGCAASPTFENTQCRSP
jgi:hypothetical protein